MQRDEEHNRYLAARRGSLERLPAAAHDRRRLRDRRRIPDAAREPPRHPGVDRRHRRRDAGRRSPRSRRPGAAADGTAIGGAPVDEATKLAAEPKDRVAGRRRTASDVTLHSLDELVEFFIAAGKKGVAINRYKGLGEMNPEQLWATTMDPDSPDAAAGARRRSHRSRPDVHDADGRPGRAAPQVHRRQRAGRQEPRCVAAQSWGSEATSAASSLQPRSPSPDP